MSSVVGEILYKFFPFNSKYISLVDVTVQIAGSYADPLVENLSINGYVMLIILYDKNPGRRI